MKQKSLILTEPENCFAELHTNQISPMKVLVHYDKTV